MSEEMMQRKHNKALTPAARCLRKNMTEEEKQLWYQFLRHYPVRFLRQKVVGRSIADFYCAKAGLVVEVDGSQHYTEQGMASDKERTELLALHGLTVIRVSNRDVKMQFPHVCAYIDTCVKEALRRKNASAETE